MIDLLRVHPGAGSDEEDAQPLIRPVPRLGL